MNEYLSTFVSGLSQPVSKALTQSISADVESVFNSSILYKSSGSIQKIRKLPWFSNTFQVMDSTPFFEGMDELGLARIFFDRICEINFPKIEGETFRIIISYKSRLCSIPEGDMQVLEKAVQAKTGMVPGRKKPDVELWIMERDEKKAFFLYRITEHKPWKTPSKGELQPHLASIMCHIAGISDQDIMLDPFCGNGAIPMARVRLGKAKTIIASDTDKEKLKRMRRKRNGIKKKTWDEFLVKNMDAGKLPEIEPGSITHIITDPPWGMYEQISARDLKKLYYAFFNRARIVLSEKGCLVILVARDFPTEVLTGLFVIKERFNILLSGKKASIVKCVKGSGINN